MWSIFGRNPQPQPEPQPAKEPGWTPQRTRAATIDRIGPTAIATLTVKELVRSEGMDLLMELFRELSGSGAKSLVLDIQNLDYMDSLCLGCLVQALNGAVRGGGRIALVNPDTNLQEFFRLASLDRRFPICHDVPAALAALERAA